MRPSSIKIKDLPKQIKNLLIFLELDEEKGINEPQPLGSKLRQVVKKDNDDDETTERSKDPLVPLNHIIEIYEWLLKDELGSKLKSELSKYIPGLNQKFFINVIKSLFEAGADPELIHRNMPCFPEQNPLVRALSIGADENADGKVPSLFSTILKYSSFDVNKSYFDYTGIEEDVTPLGYMAGRSLDNEFHDIHDIEELLNHPDHEINTGEDLLYIPIIQLHPNLELIRMLLDYGYNPNQTQIQQQTETNASKVNETVQDGGTLLLAYNDFLFGRESYQSLNLIFNCGRELDLTLKDKEGDTLFKKCTHALTGNPFILELCVTELKVQALQKWRYLTKKRDELKKSYDILRQYEAPYSFLYQALGKPSQYKYDFFYLYAALILDEKVISPVEDLILSLVEGRGLLSEIPAKVRDTFESAGFLPNQDLIKRQNIKLREAKSPAQKQPDVKALTNQKKTDLKEAHDSKAEIILMDVTPLEYAAHKGDKFLTQVLLMNGKVRSVETVTPTALRVAITKANLNIIQVLLSQLYIHKPLEIFKFALDTSNYSNPDRQFAVIQLLLEHKSINDGVSNWELGKAFLDLKGKQLSLSSVLSKGMQKITRETGKSFTGKKRFLKSFDDEPINPDSDPNDIKLSSVLFKAIKKRAFEKLKSYSDKQSFRKFIADEFFLSHFNALDDYHWNFLLRPYNTKPVSEDKESQQEMSTESKMDSKIEKYSGPLKESTSETQVTSKKSTSEKFISMDESKKTVGDVVIEKLTKFIVPVGLTIDPNNFKADSHFIKPLLNELLSELDYDIAAFDKSDRPLLDKAFAAFRAGPEKFQEGLACIKNINIKRLSKYIASIGKDSVTKTDMHNPVLAYFELALQLLKKVGDLDDQDKRLIGLMKFTAGCFYLHKETYLLAINHLKGCDEALKSIKNPQIIELRLFTWLILYWLVGQNGETVKGEKNDTYLKGIECSHSLIEIDDPMDRHIHGYLNAVRSVSHHQLEHSQLLQIYFKIVSLIFKIKDRPVLKQLNKDQLEIYRVALLKLIFDYKDLPKKDWKILVECYLNVYPPEDIKAFDQLDDDEHADAVIILQHLSHIISELSIDDAHLKDRILRKSLAHNNAIKYSSDYTKKIPPDVKENLIDDVITTLGLQTDKNSKPQIPSKEGITEAKEHSEYPKFNWNSSFENDLNLIFDTDEVKDFSADPSNTQPLSFNKPFFIKLKEYLKSKLAEQKKVFQPSMLDSLILRLENKDNNFKLTLSEIAQQIAAFNKICKRTETVTATKIDESKIEYQIIISAINLDYRDANNAITLLTTNFETIAKILTSKYASILNKANISRSIVESDKQNLAKLKNDFDDLLQKKDKESLNYEDILPELKALKEKFAVLKAILESKVNTYTKVEKTYKDKVIQSSVSDTTDSTSDIKTKLERAKQEREEKKQQMKKNKAQQTRAQAERKQKWKEEQEQKRAQQKAKADKIETPKKESKQAKTPDKSKDESKDVKTTPRTMLSQKQQNFLSYALKNLLYLGFHYADFKLRHKEQSEQIKQKLESKDQGQSKSLENSLDDITHYAICYDMLRCFQALSIYKNFGGYTAAALPKEDITFTRHAMMHGFWEATQQAVIESAELLYSDLPKDLINRRNARQIYELQLEQSQIIKLVQAYKLATDTHRFSIDSSYPLVVDDMPVYQHLHQYHSDKDVAFTNDDELLKIVWVKTAPIITKIMENVTKVFATEPREQKDINRFMECFLPHFQALKMLLAICGEFRTEQHCEKTIKQLRELKDADKDNEEILNSTISFLIFLKMCRPIRNRIGHEYPEDCTITEVYDAWRMLKSVKNTPQLDISKLKTKPKPKDSVILSHSIWFESNPSTTSEKLISMDENDDTDSKDPKQQKLPSKDKKMIKATSDSRELFKKALAKSKNFEFVPRQTHSITQQFQQPSLPVTKSAGTSPNYSDKMHFFGQMPKPITSPGSIALATTSDYSSSDTSTHSSSTKG